MKPAKSRDVINTVWKLLARSDRKNAVILLFVMIFFACVEVVGIGAVLVFMNLAVSPEKINESAFWSELKSYSGLSDSYHFLLLVGGLTLVFIIIRNVVGVFELWLRTKFTSGLQHSIQLRLITNYIRQPVQFFYLNNSATLNRNVLQESSRMVGGVVIPVIDIIGNGVVTIAIISLLLIREPVMTLIAFSLLGSVYGLIYLIFKNRAYRLGKQRFSGNEGMFKACQETFGAVKEIKLMGKEGYFVEMFREKSRSYFDAQIKMRMLDGTPRFILELFIFGGIVSLVLYMLYGERNNIEDVVNVLALFGVSIYRAFPKLDGFVKAFFSLKYDRVAAETIIDGLSNCPVVREETDRSRLHFTDSIQLDSVSYRYPGAGYHAVRNITLSIPKYESVGFVGKTGSGKSTLIDLISGIIRPDSGRVIVDGSELSSEIIPGWQQNLGYVPQSIYLTDDTIARNIAFGVPEEDIDYSQVEHVSRLTHIHEFIESELSDGYDTVVGERGVRLSGGQRQRIGIARALYQDPEILILDEATSSLDNVTEALVNEAIKTLAEKVTIIIIAHRLSTVRNCDQIYLLDSGELRANGTYQELVNSDISFQEMTRLASDSGANI